MDEDPDYTRLRCGLPTYQIRKPIFNEIEIESNNKNSQYLGTVTCSFCNEENSGIKWFSKKENINKTICYDCIFYSLYKIDVISLDLTQK